jgi:hypothetical protein
MMGGFDGNKAARNPLDFRNHCAGNVLTGRFT